MIIDVPVRPRAAGGIERSIIMGGTNMLNITNTFEDGTVRCALEGRLDTLTAPELEQQLRAEM